MFGLDTKILHVKKAVSARKEADHLVALLRDGWEIATELPEVGGDRFTILTRKRGFWSLFKRAPAPVAPRGEAIYRSGPKPPA